MLAKRFVAIYISGMLLTPACLWAEKGQVIPGAKETFSVRPSPSVCETNAGTWPVAAKTAAGAQARPDVRVDIGARMRGMWR